MSALVGYVRGWERVCEGGGGVWDPEQGGQTHSYTSWYGGREEGRQTVNSRGETRGVPGCLKPRQIPPSLWRIPEY